MNLRLQLPSGVRWSGTLVAALAASAIAAGVVVSHVGPLVADAFLPSSKPGDVDTVTPLLAQHEQVHGLYARRFEGRSLFFAPPDWKRKIPPPPTNYTGPKPVGMLGSNVFLEGGRTLVLGQETDGVTLLEVVSPWKIRVKHKGKEYDVDVGQLPSESVFRPLTPGGLPPGMSVSPPSTASPAASAGTTTGAPTVDARQATAPVATSGAEAPPAIPMPLTRAAVSRMDMPAAREAMAKVVAARGRDDLDPALSQRLESEEQWLVERISELTR